MKYLEIFSEANIEISLEKFDIFNIFAQNIDCGYTLEQPWVLTSTHNLCFGSKIRKWVFPRIPQFYCINVGYKGVHISRTCFPDAFLHLHEHGRFFSSPEPKAHR